MLPQSHASSTTAASSRDGERKEADDGHFNGRFETVGMISLKKDCFFGNSLPCWGENSV